MEFKTGELEIEKIYRGVCAFLNTDVGIFSAIVGVFPFKLNMFKSNNAITLAYNCKQQTLCSFVYFLSSYMLKKIFIIVLTALSITTNAQTWQDTALLIDKIMARYSDVNPGAQVAVSKNGQLIYSSARGMSDLEHNVPLTKQSKIEAGSVSKQFTAAAILLLEQQGKLSLNDDVRIYVPEVPNYGYTITLRHLINHTSGLKDWGVIAEIAGWPRGTKAYSNDDALQIISMQKTLNNKPGDEFIYSNSNYNIQAIIVQRVSGMNLAEFSKKYIFDPAAMQNTEWRDNYRRVVPNRAIAYSKNGNNYVTDMPNENAYGNGGLLTTAEDLLLWNNFFLNGKLGSPSLLTKQITVSQLNTGKRNFYASGLFIDSPSPWSVSSPTNIANYERKENGWLGHQPGKRKNIKK